MVSSMIAHHHGLTRHFYLPFLISSQIVLSMFDWFWLPEKFLKWNGNCKPFSIVSCVWDFMHEVEKNKAVFWEMEYIHCKISYGLMPYGNMVISNQYSRRCFCSCYPFYYFFSWKMGCTIGFVGETSWDYFWACFLMHKVWRFNWCFTSMVHAIELECMIWI